MIINNIGINFAGGGGGSTGGSCTLTSATFTANSAYTPTDADGWSAVTVDVPSDDRLPKLFNNSLTAVTAEDLSGVTAIRDYQFYGLTNLRSVELPDTVGTIYQGGFMACGITDIDLSPVNIIAYSAFTNCYSLTGVTNFDLTPNNALFGYTFYGCTGLTNLAIAAKSIDGTGHFSECKNLTSVTFTKNIEAIGSNTSSRPFASDTALTYIDLTHNYMVASLSNKNQFTAFTPNYEIRVPQILYDKWTASTNWSDSTIVGHIVGVETDYYQPNYFLYRTTDNSAITITGVWGKYGYIGQEYDEGNEMWEAEFIGTAINVPNMWQNNQSIKYVELRGNDWSELNQSCFQGSAIQMFDAEGSSLTKIGSGAFASCTTLTSVTLPSTLTTIDSLAFRDCSMLDTLTFMSFTPPTLTIASTVFNGVPTTGGTIHVPIGCTAAYQSWIPSQLSDWTIVDDVEVPPTIVFTDSQTTALTVPYDTTAYTIDIKLGTYGKIANSLTSQSKIVITADTTGLTFTTNSNKRGVPVTAATDNWKVFANADDELISDNVLFEIPSMTLTKTANPNAIRWADELKFVTTDANQELAITSSKPDEIYLNDASTNYQDSAITLTGSKYTFAEAGEHTVKVVVSQVQYNAPVGNYMSVGMTELRYTNYDNLTSASQFVVQAGSTKLRNNPNLTTLRIAPGCTTFYANFIYTTKGTTANFNKIVIEDPTTAPTLTSSFPNWVKQINGTLEVATGVDVSAWQTALGENWTVSRV